MYYKTSPFGLSHSGRYGMESQLSEETENKWHFSRVSDKIARFYSYLVITCQDLISLFFFLFFFP